MQKYAILISYLGTHYCGWQRQKGAQEGKSIHEAIEAAIKRITQEEKVSLVGSGRTDAGVHALGQVGHFTVTRKRWDPEILERGLNSLLPRSIRILRVVEVEAEFHAQRSAIKKQYSYYFQQGLCELPQFEPISWWIRKRLDVEAMNRAIQPLIGEHDFKALQASGAKPGPTVRTILEAEVSFEPIGFPIGGLAFDPESGFGFVRVRVLGTGFLKQMVRSIAGTLLQVGEGRREIQCFEEILATKRRDLVGPTSPGRGLWLERVWYPKLEIDFHSRVRLQDSSYGISSQS